MNWKGEAHVGKIQIEKSAYATNKGRNEGDTCLSASNGLTETEEKREIAVNAVVPFEFTRCLDTLPRRCDLDEDTLLLDTDRFVQGNELFGLDDEKESRQHQHVCRITCSRDRGQFTFFLVPSLSKERRASTSVDTRPGIIARISFPNSTS